MDSTTRAQPTLRETVIGSDCDAVETLVAATGYFRDDEIEVARELVEERLSKGIKSGYYFIFLEENGTMLGYACYGPIGCSTHSYDLYWIAVRNTIQSRGLGSRILQAAEKRIATMGGKRVYIETSSQEKYASTRFFYSKNGYALEAELVDFYADGDNKLIYSKEISHE